MTHAMASRARGSASSVPLDGPRIAAGAGAIALNVVLLMLLMVPLRIIAPAPETTRTEVDWLPPVPEKRIEPVPVPVEQPRVVQQPTATQTPRVRQPPSPQPVVEAMPGDLPAPPPMPVVTPSGPTDTGPVEVMDGAVLRYALAPPPPYPRRALRAGTEGTVLLEVLVDVDGRPLQVEVVGSSGDRELDRAAQRQVLERWTFQPAVRDGRPVQAIGLVPIEFSLN